MNRSRSLRVLTVSVLIALWVSLPLNALAGSRDILWDIIGNCLDPSAADYCAKCRAPRAETACAAENFCKETTEVWAETADFVAVRDRKMCGCPSGLVHGLAIPRARVAGVEDPRRPAAIWEFAWATGRSKIPEEDLLTVVVNPRSGRSQDQMHLHMVRLKKDARSRFSSYPTARIRDLANVWDTASRLACAAKLSEYGVLVARDPGGGFVVLVDAASPEKDFVQERCLPNQPHQP
ncbi:CDP-diacylglycerol diphosphatase [Geomonas sp. Red32]|uniref:CDP-diacylglycerol diphosphatase n=1 Tax=Geomonas sp. Red32 TaxID=2912856 RepID=UPI00202CBA56|nr:CDP-diacylglycerol diphosphatase [Geomonas sp. Red32]